MNPSTRTASPLPGPVSNPALPGTDVPDDLESMLVLARELAQADLFIPAELQGRPGNILALMMRARALDIPLAVAWDELYLAGPDQDVAQTAKLARALARRAGHRIAYPRSDRHHAVALIQCAGEDAPHEVTFTLQEAAAMGLMKPDKHGRNHWEEQPENMLIARVTTRAITRYCPEVLLGLGSHLSVRDVEAPAQVPSDVVSAYLREHREMVQTVMAAVGNLERVEDPEERLEGLRDAYLSAREAEVLDFAADEAGERSVRQVLAAAMEAAEAARQSAAAPPGGDVPPADAPPPDTGTAAGAPPAAAPAKARRPRKAAAKKTPPKKAAPPRKKAALAPPAAPQNNGGGRVLECGCTVEQVILAGEHGEECTETGK